MALYSTAVPEQVGLAPLLSSMVTEERLTTAETLRAKGTGAATLPLLLTQLRELVTLLALTDKEEREALKPKLCPVMVRAPFVHVALRSLLAELPSLYRPERWNCISEPEQVDGLPSVCSMTIELGTMLSTGVTARSMELLLDTGVVLEQARELVTETETGPLTGADNERSAPLGIVPAPVDHT